VDDMQDYQISRVMACRCADHAWVMLDDRLDSEPVKVQVPIATGRVLARMLAGHTSAAADALDLVAAVLVALDARPNAVTLQCDGGDAGACLTLSAASGSYSVSTNFCTALLAACRLKLPIRLNPTMPAGSPGSNLPDAFRAVIQSLDLSGLDHTT
jgi:hypothetical protein